MSDDQKAIAEKLIEQFCLELAAHDQWMWGNTCAAIANGVDYSEAPIVEENGSYYKITARMKSGQIVELSRAEGGWSISWSKLESGLTPADLADAIERGENWALDPRRNGAAELANEPRR